MNLREQAKKLGDEIRQALTATCAHEDCQEVPYANGLCIRHHLDARFQ